MPSTLKWYGYLFSLMFSFGTCAVEIALRKQSQIKLSFICNFRANEDYHETSQSNVGWTLTRAVLESSPWYCLLLWVCLCHEMFFTARQVWSLWCPQPEHLSLIRQAFQSCCHGYLERGRPRTKADYWQLVHFIAPLRFPNDACALIEITAN